MNGSVSPVRIVVGGNITALPGQVLGPRTIDEFELVYFPEPGLTEYRIGPDVFVPRQPFVLITRPGEVHQYRFDPASETPHLFFHFLWEGPKELLPLWLKHGHVSSAVPPFLPSVMHYVMMLSRHQPEGWRARGNALLASLLHELSSMWQDVQAGGSGFNADLLPNRIAQALEWMDRRLHEPVTMAELAGHLAWTHSHLTRQFRKYVGHPPQAVLMRKRMDRAAGLLLNSSGPIRDVAHAVGFTDELYFSRCFQKMNGMPPSLFRKKYANMRNFSFVPGASSSIAYPSPPHQVFMFDVP